MLKPFTEIGQHARAWLVQGVELKKASVKFFLFLVTLALLFSASLTIALVKTARFLDALIGARGVGVLTENVRASAILLFLSIVGLVASFLLLRSLKGLSRQWCFALTQGLAVAGLLTVAFPVGILRLPVQVVLSILSPSLPLGRWRWVVATFFLIGFLASSSAVVSATVFRDLSVGTACAFLLADLFLLGWSFTRLFPYARHN